MQNSEFVYFSSKSGKHMKQMLNPPFWGGVGVKKWSPFLDSDARSPIFGHLNMSKVPIFCRNGLYTCWYKIYQEAMRF